MVNGGVARDMNAKDILARNAILKLLIKTGMVVDVSTDNAETDCFGDNSDSAAVWYSESSVATRVCLSLASEIIPAGLLMGPSRPGALMVEYTLARIDNDNCLSRFRAQSPLEGNV